MRHVPFAEPAGRQISSLRSASTLPKYTSPTECSDYDKIFYHDDLFEKSLYATRQLAKRQCTWIRGWENLQTYDVDEFDQATKQLKKQLNFA